MSTQRKLFEKWYTNEMLIGYTPDDIKVIMLKMDDGYYQDRHAQAAWRGWQAHAEQEWQTSGKAFMHKETGELRLVLNSDEHNFDEWEDVAIVKQPPKEKL